MKAILDLAIDFIVSLIVFTLFGAFSKPKALPASDAESSLKKGVANHQNKLVKAIGKGVCVKSDKIKGAYLS